MHPEEHKKGARAADEVVVPLSAVGIEPEEPFDPATADGSEDDVVDTVHELSDDDLEEVQEAA